MSRIGKHPIPVSSGVDVTVDGQDVRVKGPRVSTCFTWACSISASLKDRTITVSRPDQERESRSLHGLTRTLINNMIVGVSEGYSKSLEIVGTGYRVQAKGTNLEFALGYSHSITVEAPEGIPLRSRGSEQGDGVRHRQAAGRRGRR